MGRAKLKMELITNEKQRNITFKKRKEGLIKKLHELTTLCDISASMIIYGTKQDEPAEFWPQNIDEFRRIIDIYKSKNTKDRSKTFGLSDFFHDKKRKIEEEIAVLRKKNLEAKYPTWLDFMNLMSESQSREFVVFLGNKLEYAKSRIEVLKRNRVQGNLGMNFDCAPRLMSDHDQSHSGLINQREAVSSLRTIELPQLPFNQHYFPSVDHHHGQNSMMGLLMNGNNQFGDATSTSYNWQVFNEAMMAGSGVVDPTIYTRPIRYLEPSVGPLLRYYEPSMGPPRYMQRP